MRGPNLGKSVLVAGGVIVLLVVIAFVPVLPPSRSDARRSTRVACDASISEARRKQALDELRRFADRLRRERPGITVHVHDILDDDGRRSCLCVAQRGRWCDWRDDGLRVECDDAGLRFERYDVASRGSSLIGLAVDLTDPAVGIAFDGEARSIAAIVAGGSTEPPTAVR